MFLAPIIALLLCSVARAFPSGHGGLAPLVGMDDFDKYPDEYLVVFHDNHTLEQHFRTIGGGLHVASSLKFRTHKYGYTATMDDKTRDEQVRRDPGVRLVETDRPVYAVEPMEMVCSEDADLEQLSRDPSSRLTKRYETVTQEGASWGLQMMATPKEELDLPIPDGGLYEYVADAGLGVQVYIMDSGIRITHRLFEGRARNFGGLSSSDISPYVEGNTMDDVTGHGTSVAGIVGARQYGVAPKATLVNVKVMNNRGKMGNPNRFGDYSRVITAIQDITAEHEKNKASANPYSMEFRGSVINMSFGFASARVPGLLAQAVAEAKLAGISLFAPAGNDRLDAEGNYPCSIPGVECIGGVTANYSMAHSSNYGALVKYAAPGKDVYSLGNKYDTAVSKVTGTSIASPHAAGAAAIFASWDGLESRFDLSENLVYLNSLDGQITGFLGTSQPLLINTGIRLAQKYWDEPFRFSGNTPRKPQNVVDDSTTIYDAFTASYPPPLQTELMTATTYTEMGLITIGPVPDVTTIPGEITYDEPSTTSVQSIPTTTMNCASTGTPFAQPAAQDLISTFCADHQLDVQFVPYIAFGNGSNEFGLPKSLNAQGHYTIDGTADVLWFRTRFTPYGACSGSFNGAYKCYDHFGAINNNCQTNTITAKLGGTLQDVCAVYDLTAVDEHTLPFTDNNLPKGDFTCEDTAADLGFFLGTCTCWMSERPDQKAFFVKPALGNCDGTDVDQMNGLAPGQGY